MNIQNTVRDCITRTFHLNEYPGKMVKRKIIILINRPRRYVAAAAAVVHLTIRKCSNMQINQTTSLRGIFSAAPLCNAVVCRVVVLVWWW